MNETVAGSKHVCKFFESRITDLLHDLDGLLEAFERGTKLQPSVKQVEILSMIEIIIDDIEKYKRKIKYLETLYSHLWEWELQEKK